MTAVHDAAVVYNFSRPDLAEAQESLRNLYGGQADARWRSLLDTAGLTGAETDAGAFDRLVAAMLAADPVTALCGRALAIRSATFANLSQVYAVVSEAA
jgi:hypothetical protein